MVRTSRSKTENFLIQLLAFVFLQRCHCSNAMEEDCVWTGSNDPIQPDFHSVVTVKASCNEGQIQWPRPHGGLRVAFMPRNTHESAFHVCFTPHFGGINIYKESFSGLTLLRSAKSEKTGGKLCMSSIGQSAVLYLQATSATAHETAKMNYTVYTRRRKLHRPKDCKPCSYSKLVRSFCSSDLVVRGYIKSMYGLDDGRTSQADVVVTDLIRQRHEIFVKRSDKDSRLFGSMKFPSGCHWKESESRVFLLTGNIESGRGPVLMCHTQEEEWVKLEKDSILDMCKEFR